MLATAFLSVGLLALAGPAPQAQAAELPSSIADGGYIISDKEFFASGSMTQAQIQAFLNGKVKNCKADHTCLKSYTSDIVAKAADKYCKALTAEKGASAARIIHRVAVACGINPKVILVMLEKEQGLISSTAPSDARYSKAMGQACPDTAACDPKHAGFFNQVYGGARQLQVYTKNPHAFGYKAGQVNTVKWHPSSACGTSKVFIQNQATANLYIYTPYRPNIAALAAGSGTGDKCSSYGNRNFYNFYVSWFAPGASSSSGPPAKIDACTTPPAGEIVARKDTGTVNSTTALNVRSAPSALCAKDLSSLNKGQKVTITGQYGAWSRATVGGKTVWLATEYLDLASKTPAPTDKETPKPTNTSTPDTPQPDPEGNAKTTPTAMLTTSAVNLRASNSTSSKSLAILKKGTKVTVIDSKGKWRKVNVGSRTGWVHGDYLKAAPKTTSPPNVDTRTVTSSALNLRASDSTSSKSLAILKKGTKVTVTQKKGVWVKVNVGSRTGWVHSGYLSAPAKTTSTTKPPPSAKTETRIVTSSALNLRASNSTSSKSLAILKKGTKVTVIDSKGKWRKVNVGSRTGWVHGDYLK